MWLTKLVPECIARAFTPRSTLSVSKWSGENVRLAPEASPFSPGLYDSSWTPHCEAIMDSYNDTDFDEEHICKSSQVGLTEAMFNIIRYVVAVVH